nr:MAG TPA: hypothetical protein [Caudoviricetes sp.]DAV40700.1 MAG TPA: hypothetical protein [Caudoviricetes sp.]
MADIIMYVCTVSRPSSPSNNTLNQSRGGEL